MKTKLTPYLMAVLLNFAFTAYMRAQTTAFTYQGQLKDANGPVNGPTDFEFKLYDDPGAGTQQGSTVTKDDVAVTNGLFTVALEFGGEPFDGTALWLNVAVRPGASAGAYTNVSPRQPITSAPYAINAGNAMTVARGTISDPSFLGTTTTTPLQMEVSNTVGLRLEYPTVGTVPNLVGGYSGNRVGSGAQGAVIAGGGFSGFANGIGVDSDYSSIGGGFGNNIADNSRYATIAGGANNDIGTNALYSGIGGGFGNSIADNSRYATIAGGANNDIGTNASYGSIGGGTANNIADNSVYATIAGGYLNEIGTNADYSSIGGGRHNNIADNAQHATIPGGQYNSATTYAFAAGRRAKAIHTGAFVWADSQNADFASTGSDRFCVRASGGVHLSGDTSLYCGSTLRQMVNLYGTTYGLGVQSSTFYSRSGDRFCWYRNGTHTNAAVNPGTGGTWLMTLDGGGSLFTAGGMYPSSDRNVKRDFATIEPRAVLEQLVEVPIQEWSYKSEGAIRHIGPVAQDFRTAFGLGADDKHIATVDADGVALAAIQGLNEKVEKENTALRAENAELKARLEKIEQLLNHKLNGGAK